MKFARPSARTTRARDVCFWLKAERPVVARESPTRMLIQPTALNPGSPDSGEHLVSLLAF